jgi:hypothetical protein
MALSERTVDFLFNCHAMGEEGRKEFVPNILGMECYQDVIDDLLFEHNPESPEELVYNIVHDIYYNMI